MIVDRENTVENVGTGFGRTQNMGIDTDSLAHLMSVLTNLYSDPETAVIREYSTNAYDSHVEAGKADTPIQVTLPSVFDPVFKVKDQGIGLTADEVYEIYGMYGKSTKRHSNDFNGQLGLGCKSALTLSNQFSMVAIKGGKKNVFNIHLNDEGIPRISHAAEIDTDEHNGVEVSIPVRNINTFRDKARRFYQFFPVIPEFNEEFDVSKPQYDIVLNDGKYSFSTQIRENYVVMGGVAYPFNWNEIGEYVYGSHKVVIEAPMGAIAFTPSREQLHYTNKTKKFLETSWKEIGEAIGDAVEEKIEDLDTYVEAIEFVQNSNISALLRAYKVDRSNLSYNGWSLDGIKLETGTDFYSFEGDAFYNSTYYNINANLLKDLLIVVGGAKDLNSSYKRKLKEWFTQEGKTYKNIMYVKDSLADYVDEEEKLEGIDLITYDDTLSEIKIASARRSSPTKASVFDKLQLDGYYSRKVTFTRNVTPDATRTIVYANRKTLRSEFSHIKDYVRYDKNVDFFVVNKPQQEAFDALYKKALHLKDFFAAKIKETIKNLTDDEKMSYIANSGRFYDVDTPSTVLDENRVNDNDLKEFYKLWKKYQSGRSGSSGNLTILMRVCNNMNVKYDMSGLEKERDEFVSELVASNKKVSRRYPLLFNRYGNDSAYLDYVNTLHKE